MKHINSWHIITEEYELAPGMVMTISREDNTLPDTVKRFLKRKASIGEVRRAVRVGVNPLISQSE